MKATLLGSLGASSPRQIEALINGIDRIMPFLISVPIGDRFRSIIADDVQSDPGELFAPEAFAEIRAGAKSIVIVDTTTIAIDGRKVRAFDPVWQQIIVELGLTGEAKIRPVAEITSGDITDSIDRISGARNALVDLLPERSLTVANKKKGGILGWLLVGAAAIYVKTKLA